VELKKLHPVMLFKITDYSHSMRRSTAILLVFVFAISGCSTDVYEGEIKTFAKKVSTLEKSFDEMVKKEDTAFYAREIKNAMRKKASLRLGSNSKGKNCAELDSLLISKSDKEFELLLNDCSLHYQFSDKTTEPVHRVADVSNAHKLISALNSYTSSLAEVAAAKDIDALDSSAAKLRDAVSNLSSKASKTVGTILPVSGVALSGITQSINSASKFFLWVFSEYQKHVRFQRFKAAVNAADDAVSMASGPLGEILSALSRQLRINQMATVNSALAKPLDSSIALKSAAKKYETLKALGKLNGKALATAMASAHSALKDSLNDPKKQKDSVVSAFNEFKNQVENLVDAMKKLNGGGS